MSHALLAPTSATSGSPRLPHVYVSYPSYSQRTPPARPGHSPSGGGHRHEPRVGHVIDSEVSAVAEGAICGADRWQRCHGLSALRVICLSVGLGRWLAQGRGRQSRTTEQRATASTHVVGPIWCWAFSRAAVTPALIGQHWQHKGCCAQERGRPSWHFSGPAARGASQAHQGRDVFGCGGYTCSSPQSLRTRMR